MKSTFTLTIADNDCPFSIDTFVGTYKAVETTDVLSLLRSSITEYNVVISGEDGSTELTILDFLAFTQINGSDGNPLDAKSIVINIDVTTKTVTIPDQTLQAPIGISGREGALKVVGIGTGTIQVCSGGITMEYQVYDDSGEIGRSTVTLTK